MPLTAIRNPAAGLADVADLPRPLLIDAAGFGGQIQSSARTIRRWDSAGLIPRPVRVGGKVLWRAEEIRRWVEAGCPPRPAWERMDRAK